MHSTHSSVSGSTLLDDQDEDVRIAVGVLGSMRSQSVQGQSGSLLNSALHIYESGKARSPSLVRYGAEMLESGLSTGVSRLGLDRYRPKLSSPDEDDERRRKYTGEEMEKWIQETQGGQDQGHALKKRRTTASPPPNDKERKHTRHRSSGSSSGRHSRHPSASRKHAASSSEMPPPVPQLSLPRMIVPGEDTASSTSGESSRWLTLRSTATSLTGLGAAMSEESMRRLRFCLNWLMYATQHIDKQILLLKEFAEAVQKTVDEYATEKETKVNERKRKSRTRARQGRDGQSSSTEEEDGAGAPITPDQQATLHALRAEIVNTVRQVVDVVSKYAGGGSPASKTLSTPPPNSPSASAPPSAPQEGLDESARLRVKGFILSLPMRWKDKVIRMGIGPGFGGLGGLQSQASALSPGEGSSNDESGSPREGTALAALHTAQRVLALATESLDMMRGVTGVVRESLERADGWVGRFGTQPAPGPVSPRSEGGGGGGGDEWEDASTMSPFSRRASISIPSLSRTESSSSIAQSAMDLDKRSPTPMEEWEESMSPRLAMGRMSIGEVVNPISDEHKMEA